MRVVLASKSPARLKTLQNAGIEPIVMVSHADEPAVLAALPGGRFGQGGSTTPADEVTALASAKCRAVCDSLIRHPGATKPIPTDGSFPRSQDLGGAPTGPDADGPTTPTAAPAWSNHSHEAPHARDGLNTNGPTTPTAAPAWSNHSHEAAHAREASSTYDQAFAQVSRETRLVVIGCDSMLEIGGRMAGKPHTPEVARQRIQEMRNTEATLWTGHAVALMERVDTAEPWSLIQHLEQSAHTVVRFGNISDAEIDAYIATGEPLEVAGSFTVDALGGPFVSSIDGDFHSVVGLSLPLMRDMLIKLNIFWPDLWTAPH